MPYLRAGLGRHDDPCGVDILRVGGTLEQSAITPTTSILIFDVEPATVKLALPRSAPRQQLTPP